MMTSRTSSSFPSRARWTVPVPFAVVFSITSLPRPFCGFDPLLDGLRPTTAEEESERRSRTGSKDERGSITGTDPTTTPSSPSAAASSPSPPPRSTSDSTPSDKSSSASDAAEPDEEDSTPPDEWDGKLLSRVINDRIKRGLPITNQVLDAIPPDSPLWRIAPIFFQDRDDHLEWTSPTFEQVHRKLYQQNPLEHHVVLNYSNPYKLAPNFSKFPHSNLSPNFFGDQVMAKLAPRDPQFIVEVGSFQGHSAALMGAILDAMGLPDVPLLCIDPWTGDTNIWANRDLDEGVAHWASPIRDGRSLLFDQFMTNIQFKIQRHLGRNHVLPFHATSIVGARFLKAMKWHPDVIFLDSAHEQDETLLELRQYFEVLAPGGVLFGDDFMWPGVKNDVLTFVAQMGWGRDPEHTFTFDILPAAPDTPNSVLFWRIQKARYI